MEGTCRTKTIYSEKLWSECTSDSLNGVSFKFLGTIPWICPWGYKISIMTIIGAFLCGQSDRTEILFGLHFSLAWQKRTSAIGLAMFCKQRRRRTVHLCQKPLLLTLATFYCMLPTILWLKMRPMILLCQMYHISSVLTFFFFLFLERQYAVRGRRKAETSLRLRVQYQCLKIRHLNEI